MSFEKFEPYFKGLGLTDILYYDFTLGLRFDAVRNSAHATMLVTEYTGSITIKNE